jgi:hypothetical protein
VVLTLGGGAAGLFGSYVEAKQRQGVLDYDDLLVYWAQMMVEPSIATDVSSRFDQVLVDEYQDTNRIQAAILLRMKPDGLASLWSATTRSRSTHSGPRPCATSWTFRRLSPRLPDYHAGSELPFHKADPCGRECRDRARGGAVHQEPLVGPCFRRAPAARVRQG